MSQKAAYQNTVQISNKGLRQLLLMDSTHSNQHKNQLLSITQQIQSGNRKLYRQYLAVLFELMKQHQNNRQIKQLMFDHITSLAITANPGLIHDLNNDVFAEIINLYRQEDGLGEYIALWKHMYNGKKEKADFPNIAKTLQSIPIQPPVKLSAKLSKYLSQFIGNLQKVKEKKVQFFEDFEDSSFSESVQDQSRISQIVYMDIMQLKGIRQRVQSQPLSQQNCAQYLIKMKTFLNLRSHSLSGQLLSQFNKQKLWARHFIDHHQEYLKAGKNVSQNQSSNNKTSQNMISLSKEEESIQQPRPNFNKNKLPNSNTNMLKEETFGQVDQPTLMKMQSDIKHLTIEQLSMDELRFTHRTSNEVPVFNNSLNSGYVDANVGKVGRNEDNLTQPIMSNNNYQKASLHPQQKRQNAVKVLAITKPKAQQTLPFEQSTFVNLSMPQQNYLKPTVKNTSKKGQLQTNHNNNLGYHDSAGEYSINSKNNFSSSNNPFANSKTNYHNNLQSHSRTPYDYYKQSRREINVNSPIRKRMTENDLDSASMQDDVVVRSRHLQFASSQLDKNNICLNNDQNRHPQTQQNFYKGQHQDMSAVQIRYSQKKLFTADPRTRNNQFSQSRSKTRLSQLTSQKKKRKINANVKKSSLDSPQEYVYKPYAVHFGRNTQNFNNFKRNCMEDKSILYASPQLVISCKLKKMNDSKLQVHIQFQNQMRQTLRMNVVYKIPKSFKIQTVKKISRKFKVQSSQSHIFNLTVLQFPLQMCFLQLSYSMASQPQLMNSYTIPLPVTIKNFIQSLVSNRQEWLRIHSKLTQQQSASQPSFLISKTFQLNREVIDPTQIEELLSGQFLNIGAMQGYSVQQFGCISYYRNIDNLMFLLRISIRVDHILTVEIISQNQTTSNQKDFMNYYLELFVTLLAKYQL